jgi:hypothetical protein
MEAPLVKVGNYSFGGYLMRTPRLMEALGLALLLIQILF